MEDFPAYLLEAAKNESKQSFKLKEPLVFNNYTKECVPYSSYQPKSNPDNAWDEEVKGYKLGDSCGNSLYTKDRIQCAIYYDKMELLMFKKSIDVIDDPLTYIRRLADERFLEIWDDEEEVEKIEELEELALYLGEQIVKYKLYEES
ncbi:MAG: hypothetical protein ACOC08_02840 [Campylobacterales bacterium]